MDKFKSDKTLCDFSRTEKEKFYTVLQKNTEQPIYLCKKCIRVSFDKKYLCKPNKFKIK